MHAVKKNGGIDKKKAIAPLAPGMRSLPSELQEIVAKNLPDHALFKTLDGLGQQKLPNDGSQSMLAHENVRTMQLALFSHRTPQARGYQLRLMEQEISNPGQPLWYGNISRLKKTIYECMQNNPFDFNYNLRGALFIRKYEPQATSTVKLEKMAQMHLNLLPSGNCPYIAFSPIFFSFLLKDERDAFLTSLTSKLNHDDWRVRQAAVQAIGALAQKWDDAQIEGFLFALIVKLNHEDWHVPQAATQALGAIAQKWDAAQIVRLLPLLTEILNDEAPNVRQAAAQAIGALAQRWDAEQMAALFSSLTGQLNDENPNVQEAVAQAIGAFAKRWDAEHVATLLSSLIGKLNYGDWGVRRGAAQALGALAQRWDAEHVPTLLYSLTGKLNDINLCAQGAVVQTIGALAQNWNAAQIATLLPLLTGKLNDRNSGVRRAVVQTIGALAQNWNPAQISTLLSLLTGKLNDGDSDVQRAVVQTIGALAQNWNPAQIATLLPLLTGKLNDGDSDTQEAAVQVLEKFLPQLDLAAREKLFEMIAGIQDANLVSRLRFSFALYLNDASSNTFEKHMIQFVRETYKMLEAECNPTTLADTRIAPK